MEDSLKRHDKVRLYYEIGCRFPGAAWEELRLGMDTIPQWERVAVITDVGWVRHTVNALRFLIASEVRVFTSFRRRRAAPGSHRTKDSRRYFAGSRAGAISAASAASSSAAFFSTSSTR